MVIQSRRSWDDELVLGIARGLEAPALEELRRRHAGSVEAFVQGFEPGSKAMAREAVEETFARFARRLRDAPEAHTPVLPRLLAIAWELLRERGEQLGPRRAIRELPADERAVFVLRHDLLCTWDDVALATGTTLEGAMSLMRAALTRLAPRLASPAQPGCPAREQLLLARQALLEDAARDALEEHLERCADCCLVRVELERALDAPRPPSRRREQRGERPRFTPRPETGPARVRLLCTFCHDALPEPRAAGYCATCLAPHHPDCFTEHGRCAIGGCAGDHLLRPGPPPRAISLRRRAAERIGLLLCGATLGVALLIEADHHTTGRGDSVRVHPPLVVRPAPVHHDDIGPDPGEAEVVAQQQAARRRSSALRALEGLLRAMATLTATPEAECAAFELIATWRAQEPECGPRYREQLALGLDRLLSAGIGWTDVSEAVRESIPTVRSLEPGGLAARVRLSIDDRILAVDGVDTPDLLALLEALGRADESSVSLRVRCSGSGGVLKVRLDLPR